MRQTKAEGLGSYIHQKKEQTIDNWEKIHSLTFAHVGECCELSIPRKRLKQDLNEVR
jgi:hypothetical protein